MSGLYVICVWKKEYVQAIQRAPFESMAKLSNDIPANRLNLKGFHRLGIDVRGERTSVKTRVLSACFSKMYKPPPSALPT